MLEIIDTGGRNWGVPAMNSYSTASWAVIAVSSDRPACDAKELES